jgi:hypothetical protein
MTGKNRLAEDERKAAQERARERQQREELQRQEAGNTPRSV